MNEKINELQKVKDVCPLCTIAQGKLSQINQAANSVGVAMLGS